MEGFFFGFAIGLVVSGVVAHFFREVAVEKGYDEARYFWLPFLFPLFGHLLVVALPDKKLRSLIEAKTNDKSKVLKPIIRVVEEELPEI